MKLKHLLSCLSIFLCFAISGCKKAFDYIKQHPDIGDCCRIVEMNDLHQIFDAVFAYNSKGDPVSVINKGSFAGPTLNSYFKYDKYNRLTGFMQSYSGVPPHFDYWHKYTYSNNGRTIVDTIFQFGTGWPAERPAFYIYATYVKYELDNQERIIKEYGGDTLTYRYNMQGNLAFIDNTRATATTFGEYNDKVNFRRTSRVWMFLGKNYSINSEKGETGDNNNNFGLPLKYFTNSGDRRLPFLNLSQFNIDADIIYSCKDVQTK